MANEARKEKENERSFDWTDRDNIRKRATESARKFFHRNLDEERPRPLSPDLVAKVTEDAPQAPSPDTERPHEERTHRETEQRRIQDNPANTWPG